jgi:hypothetical protein
MSRNTLVSLVVRCTSGIRIPSLGRYQAKSSANIGVDAVPLAPPAPSICQSNVEIIWQNIERSEIQTRSPLCDYLLGADVLDLHGPLAEQLPEVAACGVVRTGWSL